MSRGFWVWCGSICVRELAPCSGPDAVLHRLCLPFQPLTRKPVFCSSDCSFKLCVMIFSRPKLSSHCHSSWRGITGWLGTSCRQGMEAEGTADPGLVPLELPVLQAPLLPPSLPLYSSHNPSPPKGKSWGGRISNIFLLFCHFRSSLGMHGQIGRAHV